MNPLQPIPRRSPAEASPSSFCSPESFDPENMPAVRIWFFGKSTSDVGPFIWLAGVGDFEWFHDFFFLRFEKLGAVFLTNCLRFQG
jgi:hypothetical protein